MFLFRFLRESRIQLRHQSPAGGATGLDGSGGCGLDRRTILPPHAADPQRNHEEHAHWSATLGAPAECLRRERSRTAHTKFLARTSSVVSREPERPKLTCCPHLRNLPQWGFQEGRRRGPPPNVGSTRAA